MNDRPLSYDDYAAIGALAAAFHTEALPTQWRASVSAGDLRAYTVASKAAWMIAHRQIAALFCDGDDVAARALVSEARRVLADRVIAERAPDPDD